MKSRIKSVPKKPVTKRTYDSTSRRAGAEATRQAILTASRAIFTEKGYAGTTMPAIAQSAGIALDTVYASVGKKPELFALLVETAISGTDVAIPAEERDYVRAIRAEPAPERKLAIYAAALRRIQERLAPLFRVLQEAAPLDPALGEMWNGIAERRARNMKLLAQELAATGQLRRRPFGRSGRRYSLEYELARVLFAVGGTARMEACGSRAMAQRGVVQAAA